MIKDAGVGVVVVGWVPPNRKDAPNLEAIMKYAQQNDLKVALQVLAYENRNVESLRLHLYDFFVRYRHHRSLYKVLSFVSHGFCYVDAWLLGENFERGKDNDLHPIFV